MTHMVVLFAQDGAAVVAVLAAVVLVLVGHRAAGHAAVAAVLLVAHAVLSSVVIAVGHLGPLGPDRAVTDALVAARTPLLTSTMTAVSTVGGTVGTTVLAAGVCALLLSRRRVAAAAVMACAAGGAAVLIVAVKNAVGRPRPPEALRLAVETTWSFPSGHSLSAIVVLGTATSIAVGLARRRRSATWIVAAAVLATVVIGLSRIYLGVHWTTDVVDGWLLGGAWLTVCTAAVSEIARRDGRRTTRAQTSSSLAQERPRDYRMLAFARPDSVACPSPCPCEHCPHEHCPRDPSPPCAGSRAGTCAIGGCC